jgi:uncharacterized protein (DUF2147 family)
MFSLLEFPLIATVISSADGGEVEGRWLTQEQSGVVEIYGCGDGALCGRLVWHRIKPNDPNPLATTDIHNPSPALRNQPLCGLLIMWGFRPDGPDRWGGGSLYDPESGNTYSGKISLNPDGTLSLRGYIGIALFGRTEDWTRFTQTTGRCPAE